MGKTSRKAEDYIEGLKETIEAQEWGALKWSMICGATMGVLTSLVTGARSSNAAVMGAGTALALGLLKPRWSDALPDDPYAA
jgi:hypothetical protein